MIKMAHTYDESLGYSNVEDIVCCPGDLEVRVKDFRGDLEGTVSWRKQMPVLGMKGFVSYRDGMNTR